MSLCSVIIVARKSGELLFATIESVLTQKQLAELIIVDNGNAPDVISRLQQRSLSEPRIKIITVRGNINFAKGCNLAARQAISEYLVLLKSGYLLSPNALSEIMTALGGEKKAMLGGGLVQNYDGTIQTVLRTQIITPKSTFFDIVALKKRKQENVVGTEKIIQQQTLFELQQRGVAATKV